LSTKGKREREEEGGGEREREERAYLVTAAGAAASPGFVNFVFNCSAGCSTTEFMVGMG
jgi:hypothetical protein